MGGTTIGREGNSIPKLLQDMQEAIMYCVQVYSMLPDSDLVVKNTKTKQEYVFDVQVVQKENWSPSPTPKKYLVYALYDKLHEEESKFTLLIIREKLDDYPPSILWRRKHLKTALKNFNFDFNVLSEYYQEKNKGRFEVIIYPKQYKHVKHMLANRCAEAVVKLYGDIPTSSFSAQMHMHT